VNYTTPSNKQQNLTLNNNKKKKVCPHCNSSDIKLYGKRKKKILDKDGVEREIEVPRYICLNCNRIHTVYEYGVLPRTKYSLLLVLHILIIILSNPKTSIYILSFNELKLPCASVYRIYNRFKTHIPLLYHYFKQGKLTEMKLLDLIEENKEDFVMQYFLVIKQHFLSKLKDCDVLPTYDGKT
jgi:transposase-like protein